MTAQQSDDLINLDPTLDLQGLYPHGVIQGDIRSNHGWGEGYPFVSRPLEPSPAHWCSALWRGYVATFRLDAEGRLTLLRFDYPYRFDLPTSERSVAVDEELRGDFWLVLKERFFGPRVYVPFRDGRVVSDRSRWEFEPDPGPSLFDE